MSKENIYEMIEREHHRPTNNSLGDEQRPAAVATPSLFESMDANTILTQCNQIGVYICLGAVVLVAGILIFSTAFSTCAEVKIKNHSPDFLGFSRVYPYGAKVHDRYIFPYSSTNASYGRGNDHISLQSNHGKLVSYTDGTCELKNGASNREFRRYSPIYFWTCYCEYTEVSPNLNTTRQLREAVEETSGSVDEIINEEPTVKSLLT